MFGLRPFKATRPVRIWSARNAKQLPDGEDTWKRWWNIAEDGTKPRHLYFLGKDNIPFHTVIWPALLLGLNHVNKGLTASDPIVLPGPGEFALESNVPAMEYLMLAGGQFSQVKETCHMASFVFGTIPSRYAPVFPKRSNARGKGFGLYLGRVCRQNQQCPQRQPWQLCSPFLTLGARLPVEPGGSPFAIHDAHPSTQALKKEVEEAFEDITSHLQSHQYRDALQSIMAVSQLGNQTLQVAAPWKHLKKLQEGHEEPGPPCVLLAYCTILGHHDATVHAHQCTTTLGESWQQKSSCRPTMERRHRLVCAAYLA